jgi:hypothetical protein
MNYTRYNKDTANKNLLSGSISGAISGASAGAVLGPTGAAIGGGIGLLTGLTTSALGNKAYKENVEATNKLFFKEQNDNSLELGNISNYDTITPYYANGNNNGKPIEITELTGGTIMQNSSESGIAVGNTHEEGGINVGNATIEDGEIVDGERVFSNRIGINGRTFADIAKEITDKKGKLEAKLKDTIDTLDVNTITKQLQDYDVELDMLFDKQGIVNDNNSNTETMAYGGTIPPSSFGTLNEEGVEDFYNTNKLEGFEYTDFLPHTPTGTPNNPLQKYADTEFYVNTDKNRMIGTTVDKRYRLPKSSDYTLEGLDLQEELIEDKNTMEDYFIKGTPNLPEQPKVDMTDNLKPNYYSNDNNYKFYHGEPKDKSTPLKDEWNNLHDSTKTNLVLAGANAIGNIALNQINRSIDVPKPHLNKNVKLDTNVNVDGTIQNINNSEIELTDYIKNNTSSSNLSTAKLAMIKAKAIEQENSINQNKANADTQLQNQEIAMNNQIDNSNIALMNDYETSKYLKDLQTSVTDPSQILADTSDRINQAVTNERMEDYQDAQLGIQQLRYGSIADDTLLASGDTSYVTTENFDMLYKKHQAVKNTVITENLEKWAVENGYKIVNGKLVK